MASVGFLLNPSDIHHAALDDQDSSWGDLPRLKKAVQFIKNVGLSQAPVRELPRSVESDKLLATPLYQLKLQTELRFPHYKEPEMAFRHTELHLNYEAGHIQSVIYCLDNIKDPITVGPIGDFWLRVRAFYTQQVLLDQAGRNVPIVKYSGIEGTLIPEAITAESLIEEGKRLMDACTQNVVELSEGATWLQDIFLQISHPLLAQVWRDIHSYAEDLIAKVLPPRRSIETGDLEGEKGGSDDLFIREFVYNHEVLLRRGLLVDPEGLLAAQVVGLLKRRKEFYDEYYGDLLLFKAAYPLISDRAQAMSVVSAYMAERDHIMKKTQFMNFFLRGLALIKREHIDPDIRDEICERIASIDPEKIDIIGLCPAIRGIQEDRVFHEALKALLLRKMKCPKMDQYLITQLISLASKDPWLSRALIDSVDHLPEAKIQYQSINQQLSGMINGAKTYSQVFDKAKVSKWMLKNCKKFMDFEIEADFLTLQQLLKIFPFMTEVHQGKILEHVKTTVKDRAQLISLEKIKKSDLIDLLTFYGNQQKYPFVLSAEEVTSVVEEITLKLRELEEKARSHSHPKDAHAKLLLVVDYARRVGFERPRADESAPGMS
jgi:hypothetical protein